MAQVMRVSSAVGPDQQHVISFDRVQVDTPKHKKGGKRESILKAVGGNTANKKPGGGAPRGSMAGKALKVPGGPRPR